MSVKKDILASVVTKRTWKEFQLLHFTSNLFFKDHKWYISCDDYVYSKIFKLQNIEKAFKFVKTDDCDHNSLDPIQRKNFMDLVLTKFDICQKAIEDHRHVMFLDSDQLFVNSFEKNFEWFLLDPYIDACISQHMTNDWENEAKHGYFNVGMFFITNKDMLKKWRFLSENHEKFNMYYEQKPLEYIQRNFITVNFPINYNIGWWRFLHHTTQQRLQQLTLNEEGLIMFGDKPAVNFHFHTLKTEGVLNNGQFLVDKVFDLMKQSNNKKYKDILNFYDKLSTEVI